MKARLIYTLLIANLVSTSLCQELPIEVNQHKLYISRNGGELEPSEFLDCTEGVQSFLQFTYSMDNETLLRSVDIRLNGSLVVENDLLLDELVFSDPFSDDTNEFTVTYSNKTGMLKYLKPSVIQEGHYNITVISYMDTNDTYEVDIKAIKYCDELKNPTIEYSNETCSIIVRNAGCPDYFIYVEPEATQLTLYASDDDDDGEKWSQNLTMVRLQELSDGTFKFGLENEDRFVVDDYTPKRELKILYRFQHGDRDNLTSDIPVEIDWHLTQGCPDWTVYCYDAVGPLPPLSGVEEEGIDLNLYCVLTNYKIVNPQCRKEGEIRPEYEEEGAEAILEFRCAFPCTMTWSEEINEKDVKRMTCGLQDTEWRHEDENRAWPICDCLDVQTTTEARANVLSSALLSSFGISLVVSTVIRGYFLY